MLWLRTTGSWSSVSMSFDDGGGAHTWTATASAVSAYDALNELVAWINSTFAGESASWSWRAAAPGGAKFELTTAHQYVITTTSAAAQALLGSAASYGLNDIFIGSAAMAGTYAPEVSVAVRNWQRLPLFDGVAGGAGAVGHRIPGSQHRRPLVSSAASVSEADRAGEVLAQARHPRQAWLYDASASTWRGLVSVGAVNRQRLGFGGYRLTFEVLA